MSKIQLNPKSIARIAAIQTIYQLGNSQNESDIESLLLRIIDFYKDKDINSDHEIHRDVNMKLKPSYNFLKELVNFSYENIEEINEIITSYLINDWSLKTLPKLLLAILQVSICEVIYFPDTPRNVIINEYTDIANDMLDSGEVGFVNSVLDNYSTLRQTK